MRIASAPRVNLSFTMDWEILAQWIAARILSAPTGEAPTVQKAPSRSPRFPAGGRDRRNPTRNERVAPTPTGSDHSPETRTGPK